MLIAHRQVEIIDSDKVPGVAGFGHHDTSVLRWKQMMWHPFKIARGATSVSEYRKRPAEASLVCVPPVDINPRCAWKAVEDVCREVHAQIRIHCDRNGTW